MRRVFGLGETVLDIIFKDGQPVSAKAGGSVLNALVSLARMGHQCHFISELGNDKVGNIIIDFLNQNNLGSNYIQRYDDGQSALAMAFLNENSDAEYDFYKSYPKERLTGPIPDFRKDDILLFGSSYAISPAIRNQVYNIVKHAHHKGCTIIYDPNYRKKHNSNQELYLKYLEENFSLAHIVRGSNEDFKNIYNTISAEDTYLRLQNKCDKLIYTANANGVFIQYPHKQKHYPVPTLMPISTIGAGDNFNAGLIHGILNKNITSNELTNLSKQNWDYLISCGIKFSTEVCNSMDNYVPPKFVI